MRGWFCGKLLVHGQTLEIVDGNGWLPAVSDWAYRVPVVEERQLTTVRPGVISRQQDCPNAGWAEDLLAEVCRPLRMTDRYRLRGAATGAERSGQRADRRAGGAR